MKKILKKEKNCFKSQKKLPSGNLLLSKNPDLFYQMVGQIIFLKQKVVRYGI